MTSLCLTSCSWYDMPANAKKVGCGHIRNDNGLMVVEVNGVKYAPTSIYTNKSTRDGKTTVGPVDGMEVTVFYAYGEDTPKYIVGDQTEEYLEEYFSGNYTMAVIFFTLIVLFIISVFIESRPSRRKTVVTD